MPVIARAFHGLTAGVGVGTLAGERNVQTSRPRGGAVVLDWGRTGLAALSYVARPRLKAFWQAPRNRRKPVQRPFRWVPVQSTFPGQIEIGRAKAFPNLLAANLEPCEDHARRHEAKKPLKLGRLPEGGRFDLLFSA